MNQIIFCIFCWAHRWYTRLYIDFVVIAMAVLMVDDGSYGCCSVVFNWIFRYCCQLNLLNFVRDGSSEGVNCKWTMHAMCHIQYSMWKCEYSVKIYLSLTRETCCFNWNVGTFVPCAASANPGTHSRCYDHAKLCYAQRSNINAQTLIILCIQWSLDRPFYVVQLSMILIQPSLIKILACK